MRAGFETKQRSRKEGVPDGVLHRREHTCAEPIGSTMSRRGRQRVSCNRRGAVTPMDMCIKVPYEKGVSKRDFGRVKEFKRKAKVIWVCAKRRQALHTHRRKVQEP